MIYGHFEDAQTRACRPHLHLQIPTVGLLAQFELFKSFAADRPEGTHVRVADAVKSAEQ